MNLLFLLKCPNKKKYTEFMNGKVDMVYFFHLLHSAKALNYLQLPPILRRMMYFQLKKILNYLLYTLGFTYHYFVRGNLKKKKEKQHRRQEKNMNYASSTTNICSSVFSFFCSLLFKVCDIFSSLKVSRLVDLISRILINNKKTGSMI